MSILDGITANLDTIASKVGMTPNQVAALANTLRGKMTEVGGDRLSALQETAAEHGVSAEKVQEILSHGGGGLAEQAEGVIEGLFNKG